MQAVETSPVLDLAGLEAALIAVARRVTARLPGTHGAGGGAQRAHGTRVDRSGYLALSVLQRCGEVRLSDVAAALQLDVSTVSRQVRVLTELGLVERRPDPTDGRAFRLALSASGAREWDAVRADRHRLLGAALAGWAPGDAAALTTLLTRLADDLDGPDAVTAPATVRAATQAVTPDSSRKVLA